MPKKNFENSFHRLEEIVEKLESGDLPLEESLDLFEEGIKVSKECMGILSQARKRVQKLIQEVDGSFRLEMLDEEE